jgi:hypothetical protein
MRMTISPLTRIGGNYLTSFIALKIVIATIMMKGKVKKRKYIISTILVID